jgi:hypothetical protein
MGEQTSRERAVGTGPRAIGSAMSAGMSGMPHNQHAGHGRLTGRQTPGYPQSMMDMPRALSAETLAKLEKRETRGMRSDWYTGLEGLMTVVRVLPPDLYDRVMLGDEQVPAGASIPGPQPAMQGHEHRH